MEHKFKRQVSLMLRLLPEIARDKDFALHGGTAINLFYYDMPRLSVDVDLIKSSISINLISLLRYWITPESNRMHILQCHQINEPHPLQPTPR